MTLKIDDPVIVIERTHTGETFEWDGVVTEVCESYIETKHKRNKLTHPQWKEYNRAYLDTWTKHYGKPYLNIKSV